MRQIDPIILQDPVRRRQWLQARLRGKPVGPMLHSLEEPWDLIVDVIREGGPTAKDLLADVDYLLCQVLKSPDRSTRELEGLLEVERAVNSTTPSEPIKEPVMNIDISVIPSTATITRIVLVSHGQWDIPEAKQSVFADIKMPDGDTGTIRIAWTDSSDTAVGQCMLACCFEKLSKRTIVKTDIPSEPAPLSDTVTQILESVERIAGCTRPEEMLNWLEAWEMTRREAAGKGPTTLVQDIAAAINKHSAENGSNTPDWILANYLGGCLEQFDSAVTARKKWWGPMEKKA